jgi:hypothetical protein
MTILGLNAISIPLIEIDGGTICHEIWHKSKVIRVHMGDKKV